MRKYIIKRLLQLIPILIGITLLSFILMQTSSMDAIDVMEQNTGGSMSEAEKAAAREELGLDKPLPEQYVVWLKGVLTGDMGKSFVSGQPVFTTFVSKLPATMVLAVTSVLLTVLISIPFGILSAVKQNSFWDYLIRFFSFIGNSLPNFFVSLLLIYFFRPEAWLVSGYGKHPGMEEYYPANAYPGSCNGGKIHQTGACRSAGGAE